MSLNWNAEKVPDLDRKRQENPGVLDCLIWASLSIGMGEITEENVKEWVYRLRRHTFEGKPLILNRDGSVQDVIKNIVG